MYKPFKTPVVQASPDIKIGEPRLSKLVFFLLRLLTRIYLFLYFGVTKVVLKGDILVDAFKRALAGKSRCIIAFRHPNGGEPQILEWFFLFKLQRYAAKKRVRFDRRPHAVFAYGYEVVRWGGWVARFILPNVGSMPIHHSKMDSQGITRLRKAIIEGPYPLAIAPEGQITYSADTVSRLEPGAFRIGFQAVQHMADKNINCPVEILPVSIHFRFGIVGKRSKERLLTTVEKYCGLTKKTRKLPIDERLRLCRDHILEANEKRYNINSDGSLSFDERLDRVINAALETAERMLGIKGEGDSFTRMHKVRQICWDRIYLPGVDNLDHLSYIQRNTADLGAGEAWYIGRHQELVDFCLFFHNPLPTEESSLHSKIEYIQNLWNFASRTMGGAVNDRNNIFIRKVIIQPGPVINLSDYLPQYNKDKKATIAQVMSRLEK
jgi:1-acyl-sn-glycerol-3-phosphate acyltransferase